jgi:hypothetical protein
MARLRLVRVGVGQDSPPRFPGHHQPLRPSWGCFDESDPECSRREIDLGAHHGIDVFLFDWYWYSGVRLMEEALEKGFLKAPNRGRITFALMWANHANTMSHSRSPNSNIPTARSS